MLKYLALSLMTLGTLTTISFSPTTLTAWMGLELNTLGFIPMMKNKNNPSSQESMIKYFLIQSMTSIMFLTPTLLMFHFSNFSSNNLPTMLLNFTSTALLIKLAMAPFHFWMFPLVNSIPWVSFMLLMTWQKIAPLFLIKHFFSKLILLSIIISTLIPPIMSMNQNSIKMILAYASIPHMAWSLTTSFINISPLIYYLFIYTITFIPIYYFLIYWNMMNLSQMSTITYKNKMIFFFMILSFSGFPPLIMFLPKVMLTIQLSKNFMFYPITMFLLLSSLLTMYSYMHMNFPFLLTKSFSIYTPLYQFFHSSLILISTTSISIFLTFLQ